MVEPMISLPPSRVSRKQAEARAALVAAAAELIAKKGTQGLRLREITDLANIGFGSFYSHFASKEELVEVVARETLESLSASVIEYARDDADPAEGAAMAHRWFIRLATTRPQLAWLIVNLDRGEVMLEKSVDQGAHESIERGIRAGRFHVGDVDVTVSFLVGATVSVMRAVLEGRLPADADIGSAEAFLGTLGLNADEAAEIARRALPDFG